MYLYLFYQDRPNIEDIFDEKDLAIRGILLIEKDIENSKKDFITQMRELTKKIKDFK